LGEKRDGNVYSVSCANFNERRTTLSRNLAQLPKKYKPRMGTGFAR